MLHLRNQKSLLAQNDNLRWIKEWDVNSKIFGIRGGVWVEEPSTITEVIREHFRTHFQNRGLKCVELPPEIVEKQLSKRGEPCSGIYGGRNKGSCVGL